MAARSDGRSNALSDLAQQAAEDAGGGAAHLAQQARQVGLGDAEAERVGRGGFEVMGFVDDQVVVFGQHAAAGGHIREQQGMVDDQQVGALGGLAGAVEGAGAAGALHAHFGLAAFVFGGDADPDVALRRAVEVDLIAVAAVAELQPDQHLGQHAHLVDVVRAALAQGFPAGAGRGNCCGL